MTDETQKKILSLLKSSVAIIGDDQDDMLTLNIQSAWDNVKAMIGTNDKFFDNNSSFTLAVLQQATNYYLNRSSSSDVDLFDTKYGMQSAVMHLKAQYMIWEVNNAKTE